MRNRQHSRLLTSLLLVAAMSVAFAVEAVAAGTKPTSGSIVSPFESSKTAKPSVTPMAGEPDAPGGPLPPKVGPYPTGGTSCLMDWTLRVQLWMQGLLLQSPKRLP